MDATFPWLPLGWARCPNAQRNLSGLASSVAGMPVSAGMCAECTGPLASVGPSIRTGVMA